MTQKYNRDFLAALVQYDGEISKACGDLYGCDPGDIPCELDVNELKDLSPSQQKEELEQTLSKFSIAEGKSIGSTIKTIQDLIVELKSKC